MGACRIDSASTITAGKAARFCPPPRMTTGTFSISAFSGSLIRRSNVRTCFSVPATTSTLLSVNMVCGPGQLESAAIPDADHVDARPFAQAAVQQGRAGQTAVHHRGFRHHQTAEAAHDAGPLGRADHPSGHGLTCYCGTGTLSLHPPGAGCPSYRDFHPRGDDHLGRASRAEKTMFVLRMSASMTTSMAAVSACNFWQVFTSSWSPAATS